MRALGLTLLLLPSVAFADPALAPVDPAVAPVDPAVAPVDPGECTTSTTVRCTGAAAPYAVAPAPYAVAPARVPAAPLLLVDPRPVGDGWRVVQSPDGNLWRERKVSTASPAVWGTGLAFWVIGFAGAGIGGVEQGDIALFGWWPIVGAFIGAGVSNGTARALWTVDGLAQAGGFITLLIGLAAGPDKLERLPIAVAPMAVAGGGSGIALSGRF
jgi:hypothetical protein